jgi:putative transposase
LQRKQEAYRATGKHPSAIDLHQDLNALKKTAVAWMYAVSTCAPQEARRNLDTAFAHCFRRCKRKREGKLRARVGYPQCTSKKRGLGSFRLTGSSVVSPDAIQLPRLGRRRLKERGSLPTSETLGVKVFSATVSEQAGHWDVSVQVAQEPTVPANRGPIVGVDLGVKALATLSDGTVIPPPKHLKRQAPKETQARATGREPQAARVAEPPQGRPALRSAASKKRQPAAEQVASGHNEAGENQASHRQ